MGFTQSSSRSNVQNMWHVQKMFSVGAPQGQFEERSLPPWPNIFNRAKTGTEHRTFKVSLPMVVRRVSGPRIFQTKGKHGDQATPNVQPERDIDLDDSTIWVT